MMVKKLNLNMNYLNIGKENIEAISTSKYTKTLIELDFSNSQLQNSDISLLVNSKCLGNLIYLKLNYCENLNETCLNKLINA